MPNGTATATPCHRCPHVLTCHCPHWSWCRSHCCHGPCSRHGHQHAAPTLPAATREPAATAVHAWRWPVLHPAGDERAAVCVPRALGQNGLHQWCPGHLHRLVATCLGRAAVGAGDSGHTQPAAILTLSSGPAAGGSCQTRGPRGRLSRGLLPARLAGAPRQTGAPSFSSPSRPWGRARLRAEELSGEIKRG